MVLEVRLAGFNVDSEGLDEIRGLLKNEELTDEDRKTALSILNNLTPETICASYARISRDPRPIPELRKDSRADVEAARKSNSAIIFTMGHKSIAEHAVFNFDIMGLSRRAVEDIERKRLCDYTEKSQRYITLDGDYVVPTEISNSPLESDFIDIIESSQNKFYFQNLEALQRWHAENPASARLLQEMGITPDRFKTQDAYEKKKKETLDGWGKEDARYALSMATQAQIGETISARNLEELITELRSSPKSENRQIGEALFNLIDGIAPSVIRYTKPTDYYSRTRDEMRAFVENLIKTKWKELSKYMDAYHRNTCFDINNNMKRDESELAGLIFSSTNRRFTESKILLNSMSMEEKMDLMKQAFKYKEKHDPALREFELGDRVIELILSSSAFAQLKRHRMNTIISQDYNPALGVTVPESVAGIRKEGEFMEMIGKTNGFYSELKAKGSKVADYILTNAHKRRVLLDANNRQLYAIAMERMNLFAQWDIRNIVGKVIEKVKEDCPITMALACGKHEYDSVKDKFLNG